MGKEFSDKTKCSHKITLVKGNNIISNDDDVAKVFDDIFTNAVKKSINQSIMWKIFMRWLILQF